MRTWISFFVLLLCLPLFSCKKEGCTDKKAINYNVVANTDDGSCRYCEELYDTLGLLLFNMRDLNSGSPYYNVPVIRAEVIQTHRDYNDYSCGDEICTYIYKLTNITDSNIHMASLEIVTETDLSFIRFFDNVSLDKGESVVIERPNETSCDRAIDTNNTTANLNHVSAYH